MTCQPANQRRQRRVLRVSEIGLMAAVKSNGNALRNLNTCQNMQKIQLISLQEKEAKNTSHFCVRKIRSK